MLRKKLILTAEKVMRDAETNQMTAVNILDQIKPVALPLLLPNLALLLVIERDSSDPSDLNLELELSMAGRALAGSALPVAFQGSLITRVTVNLTGLVIQVPGELKAVFKDDKGVVVADWTMGVEAPTATQVRQQAFPLVSDAGTST